MKKRIVVMRAIIWSLVGLIFLLSYIAPALAQSKLPSARRYGPAPVAGLAGPRDARDFFLP